ncbi:MAG TPA: hypothetical protein DDZ74_00950 [Pseudomonas sp.]|nr:hypothetical protein [Pseudomonas sp.]
MEYTGSMAVETLQLSDKDVNKYINERIGSNACPCGSGEFELIIDSEATPSVMTMKDVRDEHNEHWFFWQACNHCSQSKMIAASRVWAWFKEQNSKNVD